uniref:NSFL1 cofactor n=1 Tax=Ficedula albicollis TaxID=59894 RepID=A0A803W7Z0_FICAL
MLQLGCLCLFFLRSFGGFPFQIALASFYEDGGDEDILTLPQPTPSSISRGTGASDHRVTSFRDLVHAQEEDDEEEEGQRFYAGGSERSGQQIVGPPRKKSPNELVEDLFKGAKEHGAVAVDRTAKSGGETSKPKPFAGGGYRLGATPEEESAYVAGERRQNSSQDVHVVLKLWKSGFSLDSGELRSYQDPSNAQFLDDIRRGEVPAELRRLARGGQVNLDMEDHRDEEYVKPKTVFRAFTGEGQKLGSTAPQVMGTSSPAQQAENEAKASSAIVIDESEPVTNIQIRLADGGRLVQKFNHSHSFLESEGSSLGSPGSAWSVVGMHCTLPLLPVWLPLDLGTAQEQGHCPGPAGHTIAHPGSNALLALLSTHKLKLSCCCPAPPDLFPDFRPLCRKSGALHVVAVT